MKPASIIFLVISVLLCIGGYACMRIGQSKAASEGIDILAGTASKDEDYLYKYEYDEDSVGKVSINVKEATVNIIGGSSKAYIELVNFPEGMYEFSSSNRILTVSNNSDFSQITDMASLVFNFKGLRSLVNYYNVYDRPKTINIYVTDELPVNVFDCKVEKGDVTIKDNSSRSDYNVTLGSGNLTLQKITTDSAATLELENGKLIIDDCAIADLKITHKKGDSELITTVAKKLSAEIGEGDFNFGCRDDLSYYNLNLFTGVGSVKIDGADKGGFYEETSLPTDSEYEVNVTKGDITLNSDMTSGY